MSFFKWFVVIEGEQLRSPYEALHQERVFLIKEKQSAPEDDFLDKTADEVKGAETIVNKITWTSELEMQG